MEDDDSLEALRVALRSRISSLAEHLLGQPNRALSTKRDLRFGNKGSTCVTISGPKAGLCADFEAAEAGDALWLIQHTRRCSFVDAMRWAAGWASTSPRTETQIERSARLQRLATQRAKGNRAAAADRERRVRIAQFIARNAGPIALGSVADKYLARTRCIPRPALGWPESVRFLSPWSDQPAAVAFVATDPTGKVCGVQRVNVDAQARKITKRSRGAFAETNAVVRLPGDAGGTLLIAEGPETGLSVWAATGHETWISVGGLPRLSLPVGRKVVICRDDDRIGSPADRAFAPGALT